MENQLSELEKAQQLIEAENKRITAECSVEINEVLKKHNCSLIITGFFEADKIQTVVNIVIDNKS